MSPTDLNYFINTLTALFRKPTQEVWKTEILTAQYRFLWTDPTQVLAPVQEPTTSHLHAWRVPDSQLYAQPISMQTEPITRPAFIGVPKVCRKHQRLRLSICAVFSPHKSRQIIVLVWMCICQMKLGLRARVCTSLRAYLGGIKQSSLTGMCERQKPPCWCHYSFHFSLCAALIRSGVGGSRPLLFLTHFYLLHSRAARASKEGLVRPYWYMERFGTQHQRLYFTNLKC